jgi:hypothetical protein
MTGKLIDGHFTADQAREVLLSLIGFKMKFHEFEIFKSHENQDIDVDGHRDRIQELKELREQVIIHLSLANAADMLMKITCEIDIELLISTNQDRDVGSLT